jgi:hypothetical protein
VSQGYANNLDRIGAGKGGIVTLLAPKWATLVSQSGVIMGNRVHWFVLSGLPCGDIGIVNLYAPNEHSLQVRLWESLTTLLPANCCWLITGDFNMVESRQDKTNPCGRLIPTGERLIFQAMERHLQVEKNLRSTSSSWFSWDNFRHDGQHILARLGRFYVFISSCSASG